MKGFSNWEEAESSYHYMRKLCTIKSYFLNIETITKAINAIKSNGIMKIKWWQQWGSIFRRREKKCAGRSFFKRRHWFFYQPALTSLPDAFLFLSLSLSFMCKQCKKDTQKFNNSVWKTDEILMPSLYCHIHYLSLSLSLAHPLCFSFVIFFIFLAAVCNSPSLPLQGSESWLFVLQATTDLHSSMSSHFFRCFLLNTGVTSELSLAVWMCSDSWWQAQRHHYWSN